MWPSLPKLLTLVQLELCSLHGVAASLHVLHCASGCALPRAARGLGGLSTTHSPLPRAVRVEGVFPEVVCSGSFNQLQHCLSPHIVRPSRVEICCLCLVSFLCSSAPLCGSLQRRSRTPRLAPPTPLRSSAPLRDRRFAVDALALRRGTFPQSGLLTEHSVFFGLWDFTTAWFLRSSTPPAWLLFAVKPPVSHLLLLLLCHFHTLLLIYTEMSASCEGVTVHTTDFSPKLHVFSLTVSLCLLHCCCAVAIHAKQSLCLSRARGRPHVSEFHHGFAGAFP